MENNKLIQIKTLHTIIWMVMAASIFHIIYAGWSDRISTTTYVALGLIMLEIITLLINKWTCPLTPMARKYSDQNTANFDIYLPEWLARYNKQIFGALFIVGTGLVVWRILMH